jgi:predicted phosphodiesterase
VRFAVVSDVHGNLPALEVVLATADRLGVDAVYSTGDLVGYGPRA